MLSSTSPQEHAVTQAAPSNASLRSAPRDRGGERAWRGPAGHLVSGNIWEAWEDPLKLFVDGARDHGDYVRYRFGWLTYHLVNSPAGAHHFLVENAKNYVKSRNYAG